MSTKPLSSHDTLPTRGRPAILALSVLLERVGTLPKDDRDDLFELFQAWHAAETEEDRRGTQQVIEDILAQTPIDTKVRALTLDPESPMPRKLKERATHIGRKIRELRDQAKLSQTELAEESGLTRSHISRLENAEHSPTYFTSEKIAKALGINVRELEPSSD